MNAQLRIAQQVVNYDRLQTIRLYANTITAAGADECTCVNCKNFAVQRTKAYPETFLALLNEVGVDPLKELEAFEILGHYRQVRRRGTGGREAECCPPAYLSIGP